MDYHLLAAVLISIALLLLLILRLKIQAFFGTADRKYGRWYLGWNAP
jgi:hypothetical protein